MTEQEWAGFAAFFEASFRGDLAEDREAVLRMHVGDARLDDARAAVEALVAAGQVMMPAPAEMMAALREARARRRGSERRAPVREHGKPWRSHQSVLDEGPEHNPPLRCSGTFHVEEDDGRRPIVVACSECNARLGVSRRRAEDDAPRGGPPPPPDLRVVPEPPEVPF